MEEAAPGSNSGVVFSSILQEASSAKQETMWSPFPVFLPESMQKVVISPDSPYLFISSFSELRKQTNARTPRSPGPRGRQPKQTNSAPATPQSKPSASKPEKQKAPVVETPAVQEHPQKTIMHEEGGEEWTLRCVCNQVNGAGLLVSCEKCGCWQHAICMGYNDHTIPERYLCDICAGRKIRCKCGENLNFKHPTIKCTKCGYYVHKRCEGLGPGAMPKGDFVCHFCGKPEFHFDKPVLSAEIGLDDTKTVDFTQERIDEMPEEFLSGPFASYIQDDLANKSVTAREFCEGLYDKLRAFFFVSHHKYVSNGSRKKKNRLAANFYHAFQYLCRTLYNMSDKMFFSVVDTLIYNDIYHNPIIGEYETGITFTEYAQFIPPAKNIPKFPVPPKDIPLTMNRSGDVVASVDLVADQFICLLQDGMVGHLDEFNVVDKVDASYYAMNDMPYVFDVSHVQDSILSKMKRSVNGNCAVRFVMINNAIMCGLFATKSHIFTTPEDEVHSIPANTPLTLGIDWIPAVLDDVSKSLPWQFYEDEESESSPPPTHQRIDRDALHRQIQQQACNTYASPSRHPNAFEKIKKKQKVEEPKKKKRGRARKTAAPQSTELTLFPFMMNDDPGEFMFSVVDEYEMIQSQSADYIAQTIRTPIVSHYTRSKTPISPATQTKQSKNMRTPENSAMDSDDSVAGDEAYEEPSNDDSYVAERVPHKGRPRKNESYLSGRKEDKPKKHRGRKKKVVEEKVESPVKTEEEAVEEPEPEKKEVVEDEDTKHEEEEEKDKEEEENDKKDQEEEEEKEKEEKKDTTPKEPRTIFDDKRLEKLKNRVRNVSYKGIKMGNPSKDMKSILGIE